MHALVLWQVLADSTAADMKVCALYSYSHDSTGTHGAASDVKVEFVHFNHIAILYSDSTGAWYCSRCESLICALYSYSHDSTGTWYCS